MPATVTHSLDVDVMLRCCVSGHGEHVLVGVSGFLTHCFMNTLGFKGKSGIRMSLRLESGMIEVGKMNKMVCEISPQVKALMVSRVVSNGPSHMEIKALRSSSAAK